MSSFVYPSLLWGLLLLGVPVLIHLINMLRHRRVEWAAMEFLLASQKRNRTRVFLKQLLLLLLRMAAIAGVVLVLAQPLLNNRLGNLLGSSRMHHLVLLDDSFSMSDRRVVFENPEHDFPQRILYWLDDDDMLHARIEGTEGGETHSMEWRYRR